MTNSEYFEKNNVPFAAAMEIFNKQKSTKGGTKSFDKFLAAEHVEHKFKVGDFIVIQLNEETRNDGWKHNVVFEVTRCDDCSGKLYRVKFLTPSSTWVIGEHRDLPIVYADRNCILY